MLAVPINHLDACISSQQFKGACFYFFILTMAWCPTISPVCGIALYVVVFLSVALHSFVAGNGRRVMGGTSHSKVVSAICSSIGSNNYDIYHKGDSYRWSARLKSRKSVNLNVSKMSGGVGEATSLLRTVCIVLGLSHVGHPEEHPSLPTSLSTLCPSSCLFSFYCKSFK